MRGGPREEKIQKTSFQYYTAVSLCLLQETSREKKAHHRNFLPDGIVFVDRTSYRLGVLRDDQRTSIIFESILISGWIL